MRTFRLALVITAVAALGCRTNSGQVLLERDLRLQEDRIYQLEAMLDDACAAREATIRENNSLKKELVGAERGAAGPAVDAAPGALEPQRRPRTDQTPQAPKLELPKLEVPQIDVPGVDMQGGGEAPPAETAPSDRQGAIVEGQPTQLVINKRLTGGLDRDGRAGDEGVMVAFEPRDAKGRLVNVPGSVSVVLVDPTLEGSAARLARWNFDAAEVPGHFRNSPFGRGLQFELPWPGEPPANRDLRLFVRFTTPDGKKITADAAIDVRTAANQVRRPPAAGPLASGPPDSSPPSAKSPAESERAARDSAPRSRLKSTRPSNAPPAESSPPRTDAPDYRAEAASPADADASSPERQATRPDRPVWKPYR